LVRLCIRYIRASPWTY